MPKISILIKNKYRADTLRLKKTRKLNQYKVMAYDVLFDYLVNILKIGSHAEHCRTSNIYVACSIIEVSKFSTSAKFFLSTLVLTLALKCQPVMNLRLGKNAVFCKDNFCLSKKKWTNGQNIYYELVYGHEDP